MPVNSNCSKVRFLAFNSSKEWPLASLSSANALSKLTVVLCLNTKRSNTGNFFSLLPERIRFTFIIQLVCSAYVRCLTTSNGHQVSLPSFRKTHSSDNPVSKPDNTDG